MDVPVTVREVEYIPSWNGNKAEATPVRVMLRFLNTAQRTSLMPWVSDGKGNATMEPDRNGLVRAAVLKIENLTQVVDGKRVEIRTGYDLLGGFGFDALAIELATEIIGMNPREGAEKNS